MFFSVVSLIDRLRSQQRSGVGYLLENVATMDDKRPAIMEAESYIQHVLGEHLSMDAVRVGAKAHRVRRYWTNLSPIMGLRERLGQVDVQPQPLTEFLPLHLRPRANIPSPPGGERVNEPGRPCALPTFVSRQVSDAYRGQAAGMLFNSITGEWQRPPLALQEECMGFIPGEGEGAGLSAAEQSQLLGQAMDLFAIAWLAANIMDEQRQLFNTKVVARAASVHVAAVKAGSAVSQRPRLRRPRANGNLSHAARAAAALMLLLLCNGGMALGALEGPAAGASLAAVFGVCCAKWWPRASRSRGRGTRGVCRRACGASASGAGPGLSAKWRAMVARFANVRFQSSDPASLTEDVEGVRDSSHVWKCGRGCSHEQRSRVVRLCESYWDRVWVWSVAQLPAVKRWAFRIPTKNAAPIKRPKYRLSKMEWDYVDKWCEELHAAGVIRPSQSSYSIPVVCPPKKDDDGNWTGIRVCLDARPLNSVTEQWAYPVPRIDDLLAKAVGKRMYSGFDAKSAFHQLPIAEEDRHKTAFWGSGQQWEWCRMAMGFKNASQAWQRVMDDALGDLPFVAVYADDLCVFSGSEGMSEAEVFEEHLRHLAIVFDRLAAAGIRLSPGKSRMCCTELPFLGHWVGQGGVWPQSSKVEAVAAMPSPTSVSQLRRFLGMVNYYARFIADIAVKRKPLTKLTGKMPWRWGAEEESAFEQLKEDLTTAPVLRPPDWSRPFILHTDFSRDGLGAVLAQEDGEGHEYVVEYASRSCVGAEADYASYEGECLCILWACDRFRYYLFGRQFVVCTDHRPLEWLMSTPRLKGKLARWAMRLSEYDFVVRYREGVRHLNADCLSRNLPTTSVGGCGMAALQSEGGVVVNPRAREGPSAVKERRRLDPWTQPDILQRLREGRTARGASRFSWRDDRLWFAEAGGRVREVLPPSSRDQTVEDVHVRLGHVGRDRVYSVVSRDFYWPNMFADVARVCRACPTCDRLRQQPASEVQDRLVSRSPLDLQPLPHHGMFYRWHLDLAGPFEASRRRNTYVLVMVEAASKWLELVAIPAKEARHVARAFFERILARFAAPAEVCTDGGSEFRGELDQLLAAHDIDHRVTSAYHPQANGQAERLVAWTKRHLVAYVAEHGRAEWDAALPRIELAYRITRQRSTRLSPYELVYGRPPVFPAHMRSWAGAADMHFDDPAALWEIMSSKAERLARDLPTAMDNIRAAQHRDVMRFRRKRAGLVVPGVQQFRVGDYVYVEQRQRDALDPRVRPAVYKVADVQPTGVVTIQGADGDSAKVRVEELARCAVPYLLLPEGFSDPGLACQECGGVVSRRDNPIVLCEACGRGWHKRCVTPPLARLPRGEWTCPDCASSSMAASATCGGDALQALQPTTRSVNEWLQALTGRHWPRRVTDGLVAALLQSPCPSRAVASREYEALRPLVNWGQLLLFDPWATHDQSALLLRGLGAGCAVANDASGGNLADCLFSANPFSTSLYSAVRGVAGSLVAGSVELALAVVTAPPTAVLDIALPFLAAQAALVAAHVPATYVADSSPTRSRWLAELAGAGRLHIARAVGPADVAAGVWLLIFRSNHLRCTLLAGEFHLHAASLLPTGWSARA